MNVAQSAISGSGLELSWISGCVGYPDRCTKVILQLTKVILRCTRLSCGAQGYPAVHKGYPGRTWIGARDTCVSKNGRPAT